MTCGVPQGSILGPLLFLIYINDIANLSNNFSIILFADDTNLLFSHEDPSELSQNIDVHLLKISDWFRVNQLSLNIEKTKFIHFCKRGRNRACPVKPQINGQYIKQVKHINFLGVIFQDNLLWNEHIQFKSDKISKVISILYRIKKFVPTGILKHIYNALIVPHLTYGITAWGNTHSSLLHRMRVLQKKAIRILSHAKYNAHTMPLFKKHGILSLNDLFNFYCCKIYHQKKLGKLPEYHMGKLPSLHTINPHAHRRISDVYIFITVNNLQNFSINYKIGHAWNQLPNYLKCSNVSANVFSKNLKAHYLSKYTHFCSVINCFSC